MNTKKLRLGDTIGIISPSGPEKRENFTETLNLLLNLGFKIKEGSHIYDQKGYLAGEDKDRAQDLMNMFKDQDVKMILCIRGGYGAMRLLPLLDFNLIKSNPKIFAGFSDITILLNTFYSKCNLITFHAPMCNSTFDKVTLDSFINLLTNGDKPVTIKNPEKIHCFSNYSGTVRGILIGGNLSLICSTLGTPYEIDTKDKILFVEEIAEEPYKIDRMLTQLILANKLQKCKGIILGQFTKCELPHYEKSFTLKQVIEDRILKLNIPTLWNFMAGHAYPKLTIPIGAEIELNCIKKQITVLSAVVK